MALYVGSLSLTELLSGPVVVVSLRLGRGDLPVQGVAGVAHGHLELDGLVGHPLVYHRRLHDAPEQEELLSATVGNLGGWVGWGEKWVKRGTLKIHDGKQQCSRKKHNFFFLMQT